MENDSIQKAVAEAERFIRAANEALADTGSYIDGLGGTITYINSGKWSAACRRASMDLTRALAEMRKP